MDKLLTLYLLTFCCSASATLKINNLNVPEEIENGSKKDVILDCDFEIQNENDINGLVVKWFYENGTVVYQWIAGKEPQALGILKDRVDLKYKVSDNRTMHRALKITRISPELSGTYTCKVSSFYSEDESSKKMIIYEAAKNFKLFHVPDQDTFVCLATGVYPKPIMNIYAPGSDLKNVIKDEPSGDVFNITSSVKYNESDFTQETEFTCDLKIPDTNYHETRKQIYYPENSAYAVLPNGLPIPSLVIVLASMLL